MQQAYVSYLVPVGKGLTVDFGKFVTPAGAEVIENKDNYNYSRGLLFALAIPSSHTGARVGYTVNDKVSVTGFLVNGWNDVKDNNSDKTVGVSLSLKPTAKVGVITNYLVGKEQAADADGGVRNLLDVVVSLAATPKLSVLGNFDYGHDRLVNDGVDWYRFAFGAKVSGERQVGLLAALRDLQGRRRLRDRHLADAAGIALTGKYKAAGGLLARFEFRSDCLDGDYFTKSDEKLVSSQPSISVGLIYTRSARSSSNDFAGDVAQVFRPAPITDGTGLKPVARRQRTVAVDDASIARRTAS